MHEKLYGRSRLYASAQGRHETGGVLSLFSSLSFDISKKKQRAEMTFRLSRPVSCKKQENGLGKQRSLHAPLKLALHLSGIYTTAHDQRYWIRHIKGTFLLYLFRFRNTNRSENTRSFWVNRIRNSVPVLVCRPEQVYLGLCWFTVGENPKTRRKLLGDTTTNKWVGIFFFF